jgi:hypothetical protein
VEKTNHPAAAGVRVGHEAHADLFEDLMTQGILAMMCSSAAVTKTMLPVIEKFTAAQQLPNVTVVAVAGMISEANQKAVEAVRSLRFTLLAPPLLTLTCRFSGDH